MFLLMIVVFLLVYRQIQQIISPTLSHMLKWRIALPKIAWNKNESVTVKERHGSAFKVILKGKIMFHLRLF